MDILLVGIHQGFLLRLWKAVWYAVGLRCHNSYLPPSSRMVAYSSALLHPPWCGSSTLPHLRATAAQVRIGLAGSATVQARASRTSPYRDSRYRCATGFRQDTSRMDHAACARMGSPHVTTQPDFSQHNAGQRHYRTSGG
ncbi:hypothetical protein [Pseudomonas phage PIP]|nr:hypothetical protein [Pseudomonas phage PIP]